MLSRKQILAAAVISSASLVSGSALASALAISSGGLTDFMVTPDAVGVTLVFNPDSALTSLAAVNLNPGASSANSNGVTFAGGTSNVPQQCVGTGTCPADDTFAPVGSTMGQLARGDAMIAITPGVSANTASVAELFIDAIGNTFGSATTSNTFSGDFNLDGASEVSIDFSANPFLQVDVSATASSGFSQASLGFSINIVDGGGNSVFSFSPAALNNGISAVTPGDNAIFNPGTQSFILTTALLAAGDYEIDVILNRNANAQVIQPTPAPVPTSALLMGLGLLGLIRRRRS